MTTATVRWIHSIHAFVSPSDGISWPWHSGQSGQPSPESVARTMTAIATSPRAVARVSAASFWKRFTGRHSTPAAASGRPRYPVGDGPQTLAPAPGRARPDRGRVCVGRCVGKRLGRAVGPRGLGTAGDAAEADAGPRHEWHRKGQGTDPVP